MISDLEVRGVCVFKVRKEEEEEEEEGEGNDNDMDRCQWNSQGIYGYPGYESETVRR